MRKVKKRKINQISNTSGESADNSMVELSKSQFKEPAPVKKTPQEIKECPFNPFGDDSCDMCGS